MTALIIDDELLARTVIKNMLATTPNAPTIIGEAHNVQQGIELITTLNPNLIFLDIEMTDGTGFDLLKKTPNPSFDVIFTTAFDAYAIKAFQFSAINYLLKPVARQDLAKAVAQAHERFLLKQSANHNQIKALINNYENNDAKALKLVLPDKDGYVIKPINTIIRLEGEGNYTKIIFTDGSTFLSSYSLLHYETTLESKGFFRIFKSYLINLAYVARYSNNDGGLVIMSDGTQLRISSSKKEEFKALFI
jgi:two-component system, LytTR family, response regulator